MDTFLKCLTWGRSGKIVQAWQVPEDLGSALSNHKRAGLAPTVWELVRKAERSLVGEQPF